MNEGAHLRGELSNDEGNQRVFVDVQVDPGLVRIMGDASEVFLECSPVLKYVIKKNRRNIPEVLDGVRTH